MKLVPKLPIVQKTLDKLNASRHKTWVSQFVRYGIIGVINTGIDIGLFYVITETIPFFATHLVIAKSLTFCVAATNSYIWNKRITFKSSHAPLKSFISFIAVSIAGLIINSSTLFAFLNYAHASKAVALFFATLTVLAWGFVMNKFVVFKPAAEPASESLEQE